MHRRHFLQHLGQAGLLTAAGQLLSPSAYAQATAAAADRPAGSLAELARDEVYWQRIRDAFNPDPSFINLEYGYFHPCASRTLETELSGARHINHRAAWYMRKEARPDLEATREALAGLAGVSPEEIAITRNATESLNIVIQGVDLQPGDEVVISDQDYGSMVEAFEQRATRYGIVIKVAAVPFHPASDEEIVRAFAAQVTPRTRLLHVTHMINLTGQVLPVRQLCDFAHARGIEVIVDSAHAFAHIDFTIPDLDCDYLGTSLHKWTCSPVGLGMLYVRKEKIPGVWPLFGDSRLATDNIRKLEQLGTRPYQHHRGLQEAIRLHQTIGGELKQARLRYLKQYWADAVRAVPGVTLNTPWDPARHGAVANVSIAGYTPTELADYFYSAHNIFTVGIEGHPVVSGVRVTPGLPTVLPELDRFIAAIQAAVAARS